MDHASPASAKYPKQIAATFPPELQQSLLSDEDRQWTTQDRGAELVAQCQAGDLQAVRSLLEMGVHVDSCDELGTNALQAAVASQHAAIVGLLLGRGADVDRANEKGVTPLQQACMKGDPAVCDAILRHHPRVLKTSNDGRIALHYACESGAEECVRRLLMHVPADRRDLERRQDPRGINLQDADGRTPLHFAIINGHEGVIRRMLQAGATTHIRDNQSRTPLDIAAAMHLGPSTLHVLLQHIDKQYRARQQHGDGILSLEEANVINKLYQQLEDAQRRGSDSRAHAAYSAAYVLVDSSGCLVEDAATQRVVVCHLKENAVYYAQRTPGLGDCQVAQIDAEKWPEFCREVQYEWKDDEEEDDPVMAAFVRQQQLLSTHHGDDKSGQTAEQRELEQGILAVTDEIARLHSSCADLEQQLARFESENSRLENTLSRSNTRQQLAV